MPKKFLTVNEVARILGITPLTVRNWDQKGKLRAYRNPVNNYRMYKIEEVEEILKQNPNQPEILYLLSREYRRLGNFKKSRELLTRARQIDPMRY